MVKYGTVVVLSRTSCLETWKSPAGSGIVTIPTSDCNRIVSLDYNNELMKIANRSTPRRIAGILMIVAFAIIIRPLHADEVPYLTPGQLDAAAILPPPPSPDSAEQAIDLATVVSVHKACPPADLAAANVEEKLNAFTFAPVIGTFFQTNALPKTEAFFRRVAKTTDPIQGAAKIHFKRLRPYVVDPNIVVAHPESSSSYPSAHATFGTVFALILADMFPEKRAEILEIGRNIGWHRIELGKHYPSDVYAGRVVGVAIVSALKTNAEFQKDFAAAKEECDAARAGAGRAIPESQPAHISP
jgi:acid phosphatase (class A)